MQQSITIRGWLKKRLRQSTLILIGHGSALKWANINSEDSTPTQQVAEILRERNLFSEVVTCFWKGQSSLRDGIKQVTSAEVFVVPYFSGVGYLTGEAIPRELGLSGPLTRVLGKRGKTLHIHYTLPVGTHPWIVLLIHHRVEHVVRYYGLDKASLCLLLIGHGSHRSGNISKLIESVESLASALHHYEDSTKIYTAYLEREPLVTAWSSLMPDSDILVVPLLVNEGLHNNRDLPSLFGIPTVNIAAGDLPAIGPVLIQNRKIWYCHHSVIGDPIRIADIILDRCSCSITVMNNEYTTGLGYWS